VVQSGSVGCGGTNFRFAPILSKPIGGWHPIRPLEI